jgi:hypothetical protein
MSDTGDVLRVDPAAPVRLWSGGPVDYEHDRARAARLRAEAQAALMRQIGRAVRSQFVRLATALDWAIPSNPIEARAVACRRKT